MGQKFESEMACQRFSRIIEAERLNQILKAESGPEKKVHQSNGITSPVRLKTRSPELLDSLNFGKSVKARNSVDSTFEADHLHLASYRKRLWALSVPAYFFHAVIRSQECGIEIE